MKSSHIQAWPYNSGQDFNMWKWTAGWVTIYISKEVQKNQGVFGEKWPVSNMLRRNGGHWIIFQKNKFDLFFEGYGTLCCRIERHFVLALLCDYEYHVT